MQCLLISPRQIGAKSLTVNYSVLTCVFSAEVSDPCFLGVINFQGKGFEADAMWKDLNKVAC